MFSVHGVPETAPGEGGEVGVSETIERSPSADSTTNGDSAPETADLVTALLPTRPAAAGVASPEQATGEWEYRTELLEHGFMGWGREQVDLQKLQGRLDALGQDGWELVHVSWNHRVRRRHGGHLLIFKRLKP